MGARRKRLFEAFLDISKVFVILIFGLVNAGYMPIDGGQDIAQAILAIVQLGDRVQQAALCIPMV